MRATDIAVTGLGASTPLGGNVRTTWESLLAGSSGIRDVSLDFLQDSGLSVSIAAPMAEDPATALMPVAAKRLDRVQQAAMVAAAEAWADAGSPTVDGTKLAVVVGTGVGGIGTLLQQDDILESRGQRRVSPRTVPMLMPNGPAAALSIHYGARAGSYTPVSACSSGAKALVQAARLIRSGEADVVIAGGTEAAITPITVAAFLQTQAMSTRTADAGSASRPFAADRDGFVLGEGAGILVLESAEHAQARGAKVHAVLRGVGIASDAFHMTSPAEDGAGQVTAIRKALDNAGLDAADIGHINAHATGTPVGDLAEAKAIRTVFGDAACVTAPKASLGHLFGAAGAVEAILTIKSIAEDVVPPTRNLHQGNVDPQIGLDIAVSSRYGTQSAALSNSFGFGGQNVSLVFSKSQE
ncbi:3-oxoacyl-[acyl-carrier-protein] synthase II [Paenarthrobacter nicotinovorans]|uniref:beta-ketoacyl-[acyl-carrier-protein] synthase family protein n=1 Tax=Micrococcaceae TaxID=1268 RepID=UPI0008762612|nr:MULTISPECIES: beta-ketoacyl-[acyl-carrier-protein] synthase family protein [Micrococcaceae]MDR6435340.1 3-oxoacyl-[acyl-carrier-protein] synthase II [Paenarthrobacter nicotinovorans]SCZ49494.1 3-oxoacyl-[acyl-carrier-protein] synthase II [Arthrobacter sp. UNCCL28]